VEPLSVVLESPALVVRCGFDLYTDGVVRFHDMPFLGCFLLATTKGSGAEGMPIRSEN
jgi:hypothetical protein